jgi:hypothetical protein
VWHPFRRFLEGKKMKRHDEIAMLKQQVAILTRDNKNLSVACDKLGNENFGLRRALTALRCEYRYELERLRKPGPSIEVFVDGEEWGPVK